LQIFPQTVRDTILEFLNRIAVGVKTAGILSNQLQFLRAAHAQF